MVANNDNLSGTDIVKNTTPGTLNERQEIQMKKDNVKYYSWDEIEKHNSEESAWLVIRGKVYDVTEFQHRHPGGDMILLGAGRHTTELFLSHHTRAVTENESLMNKFYIGDVEPDPENISEERIKNQHVAHLYDPKSQTNFHMELRKRVENYFEENNLKPRDNTEMYLKTILSLTVWFTSYLLTYYLIDSFAVSVLFAVLFGYANANIGMGMMHDANHGGYSDSPKLNRFIALFFDMLGGNSYTWKMIHSVGHHVHTNVEERDPDIHTNDPHFRKIKKGQTSYPWYKLQHIYLPFLYCTLLFELAFRDFAAMVLGRWGGVKFQPVPKGEYRLFAMTKIWWLIYSLALPLKFSVHSTQQVIFLWFLAYCLASFLLVLMFQVNHVTPLTDTYHVGKDGVVHHDWAETQVSGSSNFASGSWLWNHISGGLNHQTEHHLFPSICHIHYPKLQPIVRKCCEEYGVKYNTYDSFLDAVFGHFKLLKDMGSKGYVLTSYKIE